MKHFFIAAIVLCTAACTKNQYESHTSPQFITEKPVASGLQDDNITGEITPTGIKKIRSAYGGSCLTTPTPGIWNIKAAYTSNYVHYCQLHASPDFPGSVLCGPTSYMLAAHMICEAKNHPYPSSKPKLGAIYNVLSQAGKFDDAAGMYVNDIQWFNTTYDHPVVKTDRIRTSSRTDTKEFIEYYLKQGFPIIAAVNIYGMLGASSANDTTQYDQIGISNYVSKDGPVGHFILLVGIQIHPDGTGKIWYKDPLRSHGTSRVASYTRILDAIKFNGNTSYYDAIAVYE